MVAVLSEVKIWDVAKPEDSFRRPALPAAQARRARGWVSAAREDEESIVRQEDTIHHIRAWKADGNVGLGEDEELVCEFPSRPGDGSDVGGREGGGEVRSES